VETPGAQMPGRWEFDYSIIPGLDDISAYREAFSFETPMRVVGTNLHHGTLPACLSFVSVEPAEFQVTAIKQADDGNGWLARGVNLTEKEIRVRLQPWKPFKKIEQINLAETIIVSLKAEKDGTVSLPVKGHAIITVRFMG
jgi:alpha-mannosidase